MGSQWHHAYMYGGGFMLILWVLLIVLLVVALAALLKAGRRIGSTPRNRSALDILEERYVRGEIEREEYERKRRDLNG